MLRTRNLEVKRINEVKKCGETKRKYDLIDRIKNGNNYALQHNMNEAFNRLNENR